MSEGGGNYYKKFGGLDDNFHNQTIFIDNLVSNSLTSATVPINLPENLKLWIKSDTDDLSGLVEVRNDLGYTINTTLIDESKGDLVGNGSLLTGAAIDDTVFNYNLWPVKQNASIGGLSAVNRNLKTVEISGSLVHGEVGSGNPLKNSIEPYTHSHVHGTFCSVSGDYAHVMGKGNYVSVSGKYAHVEGSGNITHDEYGHILGDGCSISSDISGSHVFGKDVSLNTNGEAMGIHIEGQEISISAGDVSASYSYGFGKSNVIEGYGTHVLGVDTKAIGDYSYVAGNNNIAGGRASTVFGISNEVKPDADYTFLTGYNLVCNSGNSHATIVGQYNDLSDSDMEKGENLLFAVGTGHGLHDASRANMMFVSDKKVGIHKINTMADISASQCEILRSKYQQQMIYAPHFLWEKKAYLQLPETNSTKFALLNPQNAFSFSVWIQLDSVGTGTDISNHVIFSSVGVNGTTNNSGYELRVLRDHDGQFLDNSFNRIEWLIYTTNGAGAAGTVSVVADVSDVLDNWVHVAGTVSSANPASGLSKSSLYVNGAFAAESGSTDWTFTPNTSANAYFTVGRNSAAGGANSVVEYMNGYLYDLRLFSRVITTNNIMTIYVDDNLNTAIGDEVLHLPLRHQNNPGFTMSSTSFLIATYGNIAASTPYIYAPIVEDNIRKTIISDGNICVKHNWDVSKVAIECDQSIQARAFYGDGKYLKGGTSDVKGWKISESVGTRKDYFVSCVDISCIDVVDTAFKRDIDIVSLIDLSAEFIGSSGIIGDNYTGPGAGPGSDGSSTEIIPVAYAHVNSQNYNATNANDRQGINISWGQWNNSTNRHVFTFSTPMDDANYNVVTDRNYESTNAIHIFGKSTTEFTAEWENGNPEVWAGTFMVYASTPTKTIGSINSPSTEILPVAYAHINFQNYDATNANDRQGVNISWGQWNNSTNRHVFTFSTPMDDANYNVVTDRNYESTNAIHIFGKSTTEFTAEWENGNPEVWAGTFMVYASTPTKTIGSINSPSTEILPVAYAHINFQNYDATNANDRQGVNISWGQWNNSTNRHVFTFSTPMDDANYNVVTDRNYESTNAIHIFGKSTTEFTAEWENGNPEVWAGTFVVYASTPTKTIGVYTRSSAPLTNYGHHHRNNQEYIFLNSNNHDISYNISHSSYYGKGMQTRMSFIPHRNIAENTSTLDIPDISINSIDISSSETSGNVVDILYSAKRTVKIYTKPIHKDLDDVIITDVSGTERAIFQVVSADVSANNLDGPYNYYPCIDPLLQRVYIGSENGKIYAYSLDKLRNPDNGLTDPSGVNSLVWSFTITDGPGNAAGSGDGISIRGLAIGANNVIYATVSDSANKWGALYAISSNGTKNWRYLIQSTANKFQIETMPAVDCTGKTKKIYFGDDEGFIHSLTDIGSNYILNWKLDLVAQICTSCAIDNNGIIYVIQSVPAPSTLYAINPEGTVRWKYNMTLAEAGLSFSTPAIDTENNVYLFTGSDNKADPNHFHIFKVADVNGNAVLRKHTRLGDYPFIDVSSSLINSASNTYYYPKDFITSPVIDNDGSVFFTHGYVLTKLNRDLTTTDWSFNVFDISNTFYGGNLVDNSTFYFVKEPMISLDGYVYVTCANKLLRFNADGNTGVIDTSYQLIENGKTRCAPVMLNSRGQWGMFGFDCTRRGKRFPIF